MRCGLTDEIEIGQQRGPALVQSFPKRPAMHPSSAAGSSLGRWACSRRPPASKETLNKSGPALLVDLNLIRETTSHDFPA